MGNCGYFLPYTRTKNTEQIASKKFVQNLNCRNSRMYNLPPLCDIPLGCCFFTGPWTVTRSSLRMLRRVAAFCQPQRPVLLLVSFPRLRSPVVGVLGLWWM